MKRPDRIPDIELYALRNQVPLHQLMKTLGIPVKWQEEFWRFQCPRCEDFNTAINPKNNLGRCFKCAENFNTIDIVIKNRGWSFTVAIEFLKEVHARLCKVN